MRLEERGSAASQSSAMWLVSVLIGALLVSPVWASASVTTASSNGDSVSADFTAKRYIVVLKPGVVSPARVAKEHGRRLGFSVSSVYRHALNGYAASLPPGQARKLMTDSRVAFVAPDRPVSAGDPKVTFGITPDQILPTGVDRVQADLSTAANIDGTNEPLDVDVAVIDTGVDVDHPDLDVVGGVNCISPAPHHTAYDDRHGHGTHVAGTAAAIDNGIGVVGVAPGARIWAVRVLNPAGSGTFSSVICGVEWVTAHSDIIEVANMSLGGSGVSDDRNCGATIGDPLHVAICNSVDAGVTYAVAAGNSAADIAEVGAVPAGYDEVITVSALADFDGRTGGLAEPTCQQDEDDTLADFSNFGSDVDVTAPGVCILSTFPRTGPLGSPLGENGYGAISGTSMATPHAAGAAALFKALHPGADPSQVRAALIRMGTRNWFATDDPDDRKEPLVNVARL